MNLTSQTKNNKIIYCCGCFLITPLQKLYNLRRPLTLSRLGTDTAPPKGVSKDIFVVVSAPIIVTPYAAQLVACYI